MNGRAAAGAVGHVTAAGAALALLGAAARCPPPAPAARARGSSRAFLRGEVGAGPGRGPLLRLGARPGAPGLPAPARAYRRGSLAPCGHRAGGRAPARAAPPRPRPAAGHRLSRAPPAHLSRSQRGGLDRGRGPAGASLLPPDSITQQATQRVRWGGVASGQPSEGPLAPTGLRYWEPEKNYIPQSTLCYALRHYARSAWLAGSGSSRVRPAQDCCSQKPPRAVLLALQPPVRLLCRRRRHAARRAAPPPRPRTPPAPGPRLRRGRRRPGPRSRPWSDVLHLRLPHAGVLQLRQRAAGGRAHADGRLWHPGSARAHAAGPKAWPGGGARRGWQRLQVLREQWDCDRERGLISAAAGGGGCDAGHAGPGGRQGQPGEGTGRAGGSRGRCGAGRGADSHRGQRGTGQGPGVGASEETSAYSP